MANQFFTSGNSTGFMYTSDSGYEKDVNIDFSVSGGDNACLAYVHHIERENGNEPYTLIGRGNVNGGCIMHQNDNGDEYTWNRENLTNVALKGEEITLEQFKKYIPYYYNGSSVIKDRVLKPIQSGTYIIRYTLNTNIPIFEGSEEGYNAFKKYLANGDYSGAENADQLRFGSIYMDIYIDGTKRPNLEVGFTTDNESDSSENPYNCLVSVDTYYANEGNNGVFKKSLSINESTSFSFDSVFASANLEWYEKITYNVNKLFDDCGILIKGYVYNNDDSGAVAYGSAKVSYKAQANVESESNLIIRIHTSRRSSEDDTYTNPKEDSENVDGETTMSTVGLLTTTYVLTNERLKNIANKLWDSSFTDNIRLVNNNPIENICSVKMLPVSVGGTESEVYIGNVAFGINGVKISQNYAPYYSQKKKISLKSDIPVWANYAPFTRMSIYLPYIGYKELDVNKFIGGTIQVKYIVDILTGMCKAVILNNLGKVISFDGNCGVDIPITASNKAQHDFAYLQSVIGGVASVASKDVIGATMNVQNAISNPFTSQTSGCNTPTCSSNEGNVITIYLDYPHIQYPSTFAKENGLPCNLSLTLKSCKGFTKVASDNIDLSDIPCLEEERERLRSILTSGFIANW